MSPTTTNGTIGKLSDSYDAKVLQWIEEIKKVLILRILLYLLYYMTIYREPCMPTQSSDI